jgi:hypothetical protein
MKYIAIHKGNTVKQIEIKNTDDICNLEPYSDVIMVNEYGEVIINKGNPIAWPTGTIIGMQAIVDVKKGVLRFGHDEMIGLTEYVVSTYGDSSTVPKPELKEFTSIEDAPHPFDSVCFWPLKDPRDTGHKVHTESWEWKWNIGMEDWILSNGTICLTRNDWENYCNKKDAAQPLGTKADDGKVMMGAMPPHAELAVARVLTFGAKKYSRGNWAHVENSDERYMDAALRHINAYRRGEQTDSETDENHLAHAICCLMFMLDKSESK